MVYSLIIFWSRPGPAARRGTLALVPLATPSAFGVGRVELASLKHATRPYKKQEQLRQIIVN